MKLVLINRERLASIGSFLVDEFDNIIARIRASWTVEHNEEGAHGHVHALSVASGRLTFSDIVSAVATLPQLDNYDPGFDTAAILRLDSALPEVTITGLKVPQDSAGVVLDGRVLVIENVSTVGTVFILLNESDSSTGRNRLQTPRGPEPGMADAVNRFFLHPASLAILVYDAGPARWRIVAQTNENTTGYATFGSSQDNFQVTGNFRTLRTWRIAASASGLTVSGFKGDNVPGTERKTLVNDGLYAFSILHANSNSLVGNRVYCPGGVRYRLHPRESVELQRLDGGGWRILEKADQWADYVFAAGNFTTDVGTWTVAAGDVTTLAFQLDGNKMTVSFDLRTTSVASNPTQLRIALPNGRTIARTMQNPILASNAGTAINTAYVEALAGQTHLRIFRDLAATAWSAATDTTQVRGQITFMVRDDCAAINELHADAAHGDASHSDVEHSDVSHQDVAHVDSHSDASHADVSHQDVAHVDSHVDTAHVDSAHVDTHDDVAHGDTHDDVAHGDEAHQDVHGDTAHVDHTDGGHADAPHVDQHSDSHNDVAHTDAHSDEAHQDVHGDTAHEDTAHADSHTDTAHQDSAHVDGGHQDSHADTPPHVDVSHLDQAHGDTVHADAVHQDTGQHCDSSHVDV